MKTTLKTFVFAIIAGLCVSLGGAVCLSVENRLVGAVLFTVGLFAICTMGFNLFTGKVCYVFENDGKYAFDLILVWIGNFIGTWGTAMLYRATRIAPIADRAAAMCQAKLSDGLLSIFILAVFCNILIFIAVDGYRNNPHELGKYLSLFFGVVVFILCGFEHCVANMFYISVAGAWSGRAVVFILVNTLGNIAGGVLIPLARKLK